jgi:hypothetical protein
MSRTRAVFTKLWDVAVPLVVVWGGCVVAFGWANGTAITVAGVGVLYVARQWVDERIAAKIAAREPRVWYFYFRLMPAFVERMATSRELRWEPDKVFDGFGPQFKIEEYPHKLRVHRWDRSGYYVWSDYAYPWRDQSEIWRLEMGRIVDKVVCDWRLASQVVREERKRVVSLTFSVRWSGGQADGTSQVLFSVPLDDEMLDQGRGTGQEHAKELGWAGQSAKEDWEWYWSVRREP